MPRRARRISGDGDRRSTSSPPVNPVKAARITQLGRGTYSLVRLASFLFSTAPFFFFLPPSASVKIRETKKSNGIRARWRGKSRGGDGDGLCSRPAACHGRVTVSPVSACWRGGSVSSEGPTRSLADWKSEEEMEKRRATASRASPPRMLIGSTGAQMSARSSSQASAPKVIVSNCCLLPRQGRVLLLWHRCRFSLKITQLCVFVCARARVLWRGRMSGLPIYQPYC